MKAHIKVLLIVLTISLNSMDYALAATKTWSGNTSTDWNNSGNWVGGIVADSSDNIVINSNAPNNLILTQNQKITNLTINGDTVDLGGFTFEITGTAYFNGGLVKSGMLKPTGSLCHFGGATLDARIEATCGYFHMNSGVYKKPVFLTSTGAATSSSTYGNHFEDSLTITNNGAVYFNMGSSGEDIYDGPVILYNYSSKEIRLAATDTSFFNNGIYINDSLGGVEFGVSGGVSILASGKTISVGTFSSNYLTLKKFIQLGSTSQTLTLSGTGVVSLENCIFNGNLTINAPGILTKSSTYYGNTTFNRTGSATNFHSYGLNVYAGNVTWDNAGSGGRVRLASTAPDTYLADATFSSSGGQDMQVAYVGDNAFSGNITITSNKVVFNTSTGKVTFTGTNNQTLNGSYNYPFKKLAINKTAGTVTANTTLSVDDSLIFIQGNLITTSTNLLTMKHGSTAYGASNSSFVSGPVKKVGSSSFIFPTGKNGNYRALEITAPANSSDAFLAEYFHQNQILGDSLDSTLIEISSCNYWYFNRLNGSSSVYISLNYDVSSCWFEDTIGLKVVLWNDTLWKDFGHLTVTGNIYSGKVKSTNTINTGFVTIGSSSAGGSATLIICQNNQIEAWGNAPSLGDDSQPGISFDHNPHQVGAGTPLQNIQSVAAGGSLNLALNFNGEVFSWGFNTYGGLGTGNTTNAYSPVQVLGGVTGTPFLSNIIAIAASQHHALALKCDGTVVAWGRNNFGQCGNGTTSIANITTPVYVQNWNNNDILRNVVAISAAANFSMALLDDGYPSDQPHIA